MAIWPYDVTSSNLTSWLPVHALSHGKCAYSCHFFRTSIVISSQELRNILSNFKKKSIVAPKFHASFLVEFLKGMNAKVRRSSANPKLDCASSSIKHTLKQRLSVEMDSFESLSKKLKSAEERLFNRYFPTTIFFDRYLVGIHPSFYRYQSVSGRIPPDMSCHPHHGPGP